jgi:hypothetical protein
MTMVHNPPGNRISPVCCAVKAKQILTKYREYEYRSVQSETKYKGGKHTHRESSVPQYGKVYYRVINAHFTPYKQDQA